MWSTLPSSDTMWSTLQSHYNYLFLELRDPRCCDISVCHHVSTLELYWTLLISMVHVDVQLKYIIILSWWWWWHIWCQSWWLVSHVLALAHGRRLPPLLLHHQAGSQLPADILLTELMLPPSLTFDLKLCLPVFRIAGPRFMKDRAPYDTTKIQIVYNLLQTLLSLWIWLKTASFWLSGRYNWLCQPVDYSGRVAD